MLATAAASLYMLFGATSYCLHGTMADGTRTRPGSAAMNSVPLGTKLRIVGRRSFYGRRSFVVRDRIGYGTQLDLWHDNCAASLAWGRRTIKVRVVR